LAWKPASNNKFVGVFSQVREHSGAVIVVGSKCADVIPNRKTREARLKDFLLVGHDFNCTNWNDPVEQVGKDSPAPAGEKV